jgi:DNA-binding transcriptional regulator YiaG
MKKESKKTRKTAHFSSKKFKKLRNRALFAQNRVVSPLFLREMREKAGLTQRELGKRLRKPQSLVYNCETANRRVDVTEFIAWARACRVDPKKAFAGLMTELG